MIKTLISIIYCSLCFSIVAAAQSAVKVVGYIPAYKNTQQIIDAQDLTLLTHINVSFLNPDRHGRFLVGEQFVCMPKNSGDKTVDVNELKYVIQRAHVHQVKVLLSLGGGVLPACSGDWNDLLRPENRDEVISQLLNIVEVLELDGLDIDVEGLLLTQIDNNNNYTPFIQALSNGLKPQGKLLTSATASYEGGIIPVDSIPYFDFVNVMSYDAIGPSWGRAGSEHSTYEQAAVDINLWKKRGLSAEKLVLGVPFYGYGFGQYSANYAYKDLLAEFAFATTHSDVIGKACEGCDYITYNGLATIKAKTRLALKQGSGVMIWELSHDVQGEHSLLQAINNEIQQSKSQRLSP
ncbi:glycosyl hydrolase family 18 protein [Alteromonadaceae bacterium BrNp21-10]|nr:glycosyl hydrolase family 18 protein [Alteromonadaceae bacterium BrNp21-10]